MRAAAQANGLTLEEAYEGRPPELPEDHPLIRMAMRATNAAPRTAPYGTDASELQALAPCVVLGPGGMGSAHTPHEHVALEDLHRAVPVLRRMLDA
jgi:acetylornithine deacetylase